MPAPTPGPLSAATRAALAAYFVFIWGAGYVATRIALQYAAPFSYIGVRYAIAFGVALLAFGWSARWPRRPVQWAHVAFAGLISHGAYLGASHYAQWLGLSAGVTALILALQPLATAIVVAGALGERLTLRQAAGVAVGLLGVGLVVFDRVDGATITGPALAAALLALVFVTGGTLYQRHFCADVDLRAAVIVHFAASALVMLPLGWIVEGFAVHWVPALAGTLIYHVLLASIGAYSILHLMMRRGGATSVTSLLYLTPPVAALTEWAVFGNPPSAMMWLGMAVACVGVAMVTWTRGRRAEPAVLEDPS